MPDDLPDHEDGLRPRGLLVPDALRDLERRAAAGVDRGGDELEPLARGTRSARSIRRRWSRISGPWPGSSRSSSIAAVLRRPSRYCSERPAAHRPRRLDRHHLGARGDLRRGGGRRRSRRRRSSSTKSVSVTLCPGRSTTAQPPPAGADDVSVGEDVGRSRSRALLRTMCSQNGSLASITSPGTPCAARSAASERGARARHARGSSTPHCGRAAGRRDPRAPERAAIAAGEPGVVEVVVREQHELDLRDRVAVRLECRLERCRATRRSPARRRRA